MATSKQKFGDEYQTSSARPDYICLTMDDLFAWALVFAPVVIGVAGTWAYYRWKK